MYFKCTFCGNDVIVQNRTRPGSELSLGWTTGASADSAGTIGYTAAMVDAMLDVCRKHKLDSTPIHTTFAVDAARVWQSGAEMARLLAASPHYSLTIWGNTTVEIDTWLSAFETEINRKHENAPSTAAAPAAAAAGLAQRMYTDTRRGDDLFAARMALLPHPLASVV